MTSLAMKHPISGRPITIENPLLAEHVEVGRLLWYWGFTSVLRWDCPAIITKVDKKKRAFKVRSLDDMKEQDQWFTFSTEEHSPTSRMTMRVVTSEEVASYLDAHGKHLKEDAALAKRAYERAEKAVQNFNSQRAALKL